MMMVGSAYSVLVLCLVCLPKVALAGVGRLDEGVTVSASVPASSRPAQAHEQETQTSPSTSNIKSIASTEAEAPEETTTKTNNKDDAEQHDFGFTAAELIKLKSESCLELLLAPSAEVDDEWLEKHREGCALESFSFPRNIRKVKLCLLVHLLFFLTIFLFLEGEREREVY